MSHALTVDHPLSLTLHGLLPVLRAQWQDAWCVIGSAALRLIGVPGIEPQDVDLLCSAHDADRLAQHWATHRDDAYTPADGQRFRSHFARYRQWPLPVEVMGDLHVHRDGSWQAVRAGALQLIDLHGLRVPVPTPQAQRRILESFGRDKDLAKVARLHAIFPSPAHAP